MGTSDTIAVRATAGVAPFTYSWTPAAGLDRTDSNVVVAAPPSTTKYVVTVTDMAGCVATDSFVIAVHTPPKVSAGPPQSICSGTSATLDGAASSGTPPYSIQWYPTAGLNNPAIAQPDASPAATTLYYITVTDKNGCQATDSVTVTVADSLNPAIALIGPPIICMGDTVTLASSSGYSTYKWSTGETTSSIAVTKTGDYTVAVTNSAGCSGTSAVTHIRVLPDSVPKPVIAAATTTICAGDSIPIGLTESYASYRWSTDQTTPAIYVSKAGSYSVTVTNAAGCSGTSAPVTFIIAQKPAVQLTASGPTTFCEGDSVTLRATNGYQYTWWNGATKLSNTTASIVVTTSGTYAVTATNAAGCDSTTAPIGVTVNPAPHPAIVGPSSICIGGTASYSIAQAVGQMLWQLTPASLGTITSGQGTNTIAVQWGSSTATGILEIVVTGSDGCSGTATMPITIDSHLTPTIAASGPLAFCPGSSVTLDAGAGYASYQWSKDGTNILDATNETLTTSQSGSYTVFVTNTTGCNGASESEQVTVYPAPVQPVITRSGAQLTSTPASSYAWTFNGAPLADATQTITANQGGTYTVTTTDANGCTATSGPFEFTNTGEATVMLTSGNTGNPGDKIAVPMTLVSSTDLAQSGASDYVARIRFNASMLAPQSVASLGTVSGSDRIITVTGTLPQAGGVPESSGLLQNIDFIATLGSDTCTDLTIDTFYFTNANVAVTREDGGFCLTGICMQDGHARLVNPDARVSLAAPRPNPASQSVEIDYELAEPGPTKLYIEDMLGRTAMVIRDEPMLPGAYHESVPLAALASGTYRYILVTPSQVLSQPMEVIK